MGTPAAMNSENDRNAPVARLVDVRLAFGSTVALADICLLYTSPSPRD